MERFPIVESKEISLFIYGVDHLRLAVYHVLARFNLLAMQQVPCPPFWLALFLSFLRLQGLNLFFCDSLLPGGGSFGDTSTRTQSQTTIHRLYLKKALRDGGTIPSPCRFLSREHLY